MIRSIFSNSDEYVIKSNVMRFIAIGCGAVLTYVSFKLSYAYGLTTSQESAYACGAISILSSCMLSIWLCARETLNNLGAGKFIGFFTAAALALVFWDALTNSMTSSFQREADMKTAQFTRTVAADVGESIDELKATEKRLLARSKALDEEMNKLVNLKVGDWALSVRPSSPEELDGQIAAKKLERDNEAARGGCKTLCEARQKELAHLISLRAKAAEIKANDDDYNRVLSSLANVRNKKEVAQNNVISNLSGSEFQAIKAASWGAALTGDFSRAPDKGLIEWIKDFLGSLQGIVTMLGAQAFLGIGFMTQRQIETLRGKVDEPRQSPPTELPRAYPVGLSTEPVHIHTLETFRDETIRDWAYSDEVSKLLGATELKAA